MDRQGDITTFDIHEGLESTLALFAHRIRDRELVLTRAWATGMPLVRGSATELNQVWANLISNAVDAAGQTVSASSTRITLAAPR